MVSNVSLEDLGEDLGEDPVQTPPQTPPTVPEAPADRVYTFDLSPGVDDAITGTPTAPFPANTYLYKAAPSDYAGRPADCKSRLTVAKSTFAMNAWSAGKIS